MIIPVNDLQVFKQRALQWASVFDVVSCLDSNGFADPYSKFDTLIAVGAQAEVTAFTGDAFAQLEAFRKDNPGWISGFFGYDLKNEVEKLSSQNPDGLKFPDLYYFAPQYLIIIKGETVEIIADDPQQVLDWIEHSSVAVSDPSVIVSSRQQGVSGHQQGVSLQSRFSRQEYVDTVEEIRGHINRGDIYVTNFCQEFFADGVQINPLTIFSQLNQISPNPFATFFKWKDNYIMGASPERFLAKRGSKLISQPIKGTAKREADSRTDELAKQELRNHPKELQENVMIVDLVRNDLTKSAKQGTVKTEDLFGIYSFRHVHQMISTVVCQLRNELSAVQAIKNSFPMGSMTGAPKVSAMQLMEHYERSRRGVYSGAVGYFSPDDDFDFNVVIRTLLYNSATGYLSFHVGSAITYHAEPEKEYEECLLKAKAILEVLGGVI